MMRIVLSLLVAFSLLAAPKAIFPPGVKPVGPYSPGLMAGDFLYVSGQGARDAAGQLATSPEDQVRQTLENVKAVVQAAGLSMEHVVYAQTYMLDIKHYDVMNKVWAKYFPKDPPARSSIGVTRMPTDTPFEVSVIAVRDLKMKKIVQYPGRKMPVPVSPAVIVNDRVYLTGGLGRVFDTGAIPQTPREQVKLSMETANAVLKASGMELRHMVYVNVYVSPKMPMKQLIAAIDNYIPEDTATTIIQTAALPYGVNVEITGVASRETKRLGKCNSVGDTIYCTGRAGTISQALKSLKADLEANNLSLANVVASNVYIDNIEEFVPMNKVYATYFGNPAPTRTTVQPFRLGAGSELSLPPATGAEPDNTPRAQVSVIAVR